jgi:hypothetical protein
MTKVNYFASSKEEFDRLNANMTEFMKSYSLQAEGNIQISTGYQDCTRIMPIINNPPIKEVIAREDSKTKGVLERLSVEHNLIKVRVGERVFQVDFEHSTTL